MSEIKKGGYLSVEDATLLLNLISCITGPDTLERLGSLLQAQASYNQGVTLIATNEKDWNDIPEDEQKEILELRDKAKEALETYSKELMVDLVEGDPSEFNDWGDNSTTEEQLLEDMTKAHESFWKLERKMGVSYEEFKDHAKQAAEMAIADGKIGSKTLAAYQTIIDGTFKFPPEMVSDHRTQEEVDKLQADRYDKIYAMKRLSGRTDEEIHEEHMSEVDRLLSTPQRLTDKEADYLNRVKANNGPLHLAEREEAVVNE